MATPGSISLSIVSVLLEPQNMLNRPIAMVKYLSISFRREHLGNLRAYLTARLRWLLLVSVSIASALRRSRGTYGVNEGWNFPRDNAFRINVSDKNLCGNTWTSLSLSLSLSLSHFPNGTPLIILRLSLLLIPLHAHVTRIPKLNAVCFDRSDYRGPKC